MQAVANVYEAPVLRVHGSLEELTLGNARGNNFDVTLVAGQPIPSPLDIFS